jgi:hypothetical protein
MNLKLLWKTILRKCKRRKRMASPILADLAAKVDKAKGAMASATTLINGWAARLQAAIDQALLNGATAAELAPVQAEADALSASADELAAAVASNP